MLDNLRPGEGVACENHLVQVRIRVSEDRKVRTMVEPYGGQMGPGITACEMCDGEAYWYVTRELTPPPP